MSMGVPSRLKMKIGTVKLAGPTPIVAWCQQTPPRSSGSFWGSLAATT
jgi:hypothetical protein